MVPLTLSPELVRDLIRYLVSRPYAEVAQLLERVNQEATAQQNPPLPVAPVQPAPENANEKKEEAPKA